MRYNLIMDQVTVTDEMRHRILNHIRVMDLSQKPKALRYPAYKKYLTLAACFIILLAGAVMLPNLTGQITQPPVQIVPDITEYSSLEELSDAVGFEIADVSSLPFEVKTSTYTAFWKELAQIAYGGDSKTAIFRKSIGSSDNSGDYNSYDTVSEVSVNTCTVTLKGNAGTYSLAVWTDGRFAYSIKLSYGISEIQWDNIISGIK